LFSSAPQFGVCIIAIASTASRLQKTKAFLVIQPPTATVFLQGQKLFDNITRQLVMSTCLSVKRLGNTKGPKGARMAGHLSLQSKNLVEKPPCQPV
jgi:hypothetical protein